MVSEASALNPTPDRSRPFRQEGRGHTSLLDGSDSRQRGEDSELGGQDIDNRAAP